MVGGIVQESLVDALEQEQLRPAEAPRIAPLETTAGVSYTATFDVLPDIALPQLESMQIARPVATVADEDVGRMLETMRVQRRTWNTVERAATSSDRVVVDLEGLVDGEPLDDARAKELPVELDAGRMVDGFEDGLVGVHAGEDRTLELAFPENYRGASRGQAGDVRREGAPGGGTGGSRPGRRVRGGFRRRGRRCRRLARRSAREHGARARRWTAHEC